MGKQKETTARRRGRATRCEFWTLPRGSIHGRTGAHPARSLNPFRCHSNRKSPRGKKGPRAVNIDFNEAEMLPIYRRVGRWTSESRLDDIGFLNIPIQAEKGGAGKRGVPPLENGADGILVFGLVHG